MNNRIVRIATRQSPLALWQAKFIKTQLQHHYPNLTIELLPMVTQGDVLLDSPLSKIGGKGLFVKQLETAILNHDADMAVHSIKDIPSEFPDGLSLTTICQREDPRDAFVANHFASLAALPKNAIIGTSSLRRQSQLKAKYPHLTIKSLRGNVGTRLSKLDHGEYDAIILAAAGLKRLNLSNRIKQYIDIEQILPAVGQGAVGIETRESDTELHQLLAPLDDKSTRFCIIAERAMNHYLQGGCQVPIACYAQLKDEDSLYLKGLVGNLDGTQLIQAEVVGRRVFAKQLGIELAQQLLSQGAGKILDEIRE